MINTLPFKSELHNYGLNLFINYSKTFVETITKSEVKLIMQEPKLSELGAFNYVHAGRIYAKKSGLETW